MQLSLRYFTYITILTNLLTIRVTYTENTITQLLTIRATYTTNNTILTLLTEHTQSYNYLHYILIWRREEYFSINYPITAQASQTHDSRNRSNIYDLSTRIE